MAFFAKYIEQVRKLLADNRQQPTEAAREARERFNASLQVNKLEQRRVLNADAVAALTDDVAAAQDSINVGDQGDVIDHALELKDSVNWDADGIDLNLTLNEHLNEFWAGLGEAGEGIANTNSDSQNLLAAYAEFINSPEFAEALNGLVTNIFDTYGIEPGADDPANTQPLTPDPQQLLDTVQTDVESIIPQHNWGTVEQTTEQLTADILDHLSSHLTDNTNPVTPVDSTYHAYAGGIDPQLVVEAVHTQIESLLTAHGIDPATHQPAANSPAESPLQQTVVAAHDSVTDAAAMYNASIVESRVTELHNEVEDQSESTQEQLANTVQQATEEIAGQFTNTPVGEALHDTLSQVYDSVGIAPMHNWNSAPDQNASSTAQVTTEATAGTEIIFVDSRVTNYQELVDGARDGVEVVVLDPNRDGLEQIAEHLAGREDIAAVHIVSHGSSGQLILGNSVITNENLDQYTAQLNAIGTSLTGNGDILFYGCDVGEGQRGADFLAAVAAATGADIAASTDDTGAAALGGDWELEATVGLVNAGNAFTLTTQQNYNYILPTVPASVDLTLSGNTLTIDQSGDDQADNLAVTYDDTSNELIITDANSTLDATAIAGAGVSGDAGEIRIDLDEFTGTIDTIQISGNGGDDSLRVEASVLAGGFDIDYDGGVGGYDVLTVVGDGTTTSAIYAPDAETFGNGYVAIDANTIDFSNLEPVNIAGMATATVVLPGGDDILSIDNGTEDGNPGQAAVVVTGTSGGVAIESAHFFNNTTILIDTTATDGVDSITVNGADLAASGNTNLVINTGAGADTVDLAGNVVATGDVTITSETINLGADIATAGDVDLNGAIVLTDNVTITANDVTFDGTVDDDGMGGTMSNLAVNADGATIFSDTVGGISAFTSLTTDAAGTTQIDDDITTTNDQTYNDVVGITGATILTGANITFNDRIVGGDPTAPTDGVGDLTVTASGTTIFESQVGHDGTNIQRLVNLTTNGGGTTRSNYASANGTDRAIDVTGTLQFDDEYTAAGNRAFRADTIRFNGIVEGLTDGDGAFILNAGTAIEFNDTVGATNRIGSIGNSGTATTFLNTTIIHSTNVQSYGTNVEVNPAGTGTLQMDADGNGIIFGSTVRGTNDGEDSLILTANNIAFIGAIGDNSQRLNNLTIDDVNEDGAAQVVGNVTFASTVVIAGNLTQDDGTGTTTFNGGSVTSGGDQTYNAPVVLGANTVFTGDNGTFADGIDGMGNDLTLNFMGETVITAGATAFANINNFTTGGGGNTQITTDFTTTGTQTYIDTVTLNDADGNVVLTAANASADPDDNAISFGDTVNRDAAAGVAQSLTLDPTGDSISVTGTVGGVMALEDIDLTAAAQNVNFDGAVNVNGDITQQNGTGTTTFNGGTVGGMLDIGSVGTAGTNDVVFNSGTLAVTTTVTINAANSISTNASDTTADVSGTVITLVAGAGGIGSGLAPLDVDATLQLNADTSATGSSIFIDDVNAFPVGQVNAGTGLIALRAGTVITDSLAGEAANITGGAVAVSATSGIGTGTAGDVNDIDTVVTGDFAAVTDTGNINISNTGSFTIGTVNGVNGVQITDLLDDNSGNDDITLVAASPMTVNAPIVNLDGGDINLSAAGDVLSINANVAVIGNTGNIVTTADTINLNAPEAATLVTAGGTFNNVATLQTDGGNIDLDTPNDSDVVLQANTVLDTDFTASDGVDAGDILLPANGTLSADTTNLSLELDVSGEGTDDGGVIDIASPIASLGGNFLGAFIARTSGTGQINLDADITTDHTLNDQDAVGPTNLSAAEGGIVLEGRVEVNGTRTLDTDGVAGGDAGDVDLSQANLFATTAGDDLIVNVDTAMADAGDVFLGAAGNDGGAGAFLQTLDVNATGSNGAARTDDGSLILNGDISLDANGGPASFTFDGVSVLLANSTTIDTEQGANADGGTVDFGTATISANAAGFDISIDTTGTAAGTAGNITIGNVDDTTPRVLFGSTTGGGFFVNDFTLDADQATGTDGIITIDSDPTSATPGMTFIFTDDDGSATFGALAGNVTIAGDWRLTESVTIDTNQPMNFVMSQGDMGVVDESHGGNVTLTFATVSATGADVDLSIDTTVTTVGNTPNLNGGSVQLGNIGDTGGGTALRNITIVTMGGGSLGEAGDLLFHGDVVISNTFDSTAAHTTFTVDTGGANGANTSDLDDNSSLTAADVFIRATGRRSGQRAGAFNNPGTLYGGSDPTLDPLMGNSRADFIMEDSGTPNDGNDANGNEQTFIRSTTGNVVITANDDVFLTEIDAAANAYITADADVATASGNNATGGAIVDNSANETNANVTAVNVSLRAGDGIGDGVAGDPNNINTAVQTGQTTLTLAAETDSGDVNIMNTGSLTVSTVTGIMNEVDDLSGVTITDSADDNSGNDDITLVAASPELVNAPIINMDGGDIFVRAMTDGDVTINADIQVTDEAAMGDDGQIVVTSEGRNVIHNTGTVSTVGGDNTLGATSGQIRYFADEVIRVGDGVVDNDRAEIRTVDGNIDLDASPSSIGIAIILSDADTVADVMPGLGDGPVLVTTTTGNVTIDGTGAGGAGTSAGVVISGGTVIESTGTEAGTEIGAIDIDGTGGNGAGAFGVRVLDAGTTITTVDGNIAITGTGGTGGSSFSGNDGVVIRNDALVSSTGQDAVGRTAGEIEIIGSGGSGGGQANRGVRVLAAGVTSVDGDIAITGTGGADTGDENDGVQIAGGSIISSTGDDTATRTAASITITGTAIDGLNDNDGVLVTGADTQITSIDGDIFIVGTSLADGGGNTGVQIDEGAEVSSTGLDDATLETAAQITIQGTSLAGAGAGGVRILGTDTLVTTVDGDVSITGTGGGPAGVSFAGNDGVTIRNDAVVSSTGMDIDDRTAGEITIVGNGGSSAGTGNIDHGVNILAAAVTSVDGDVTITGTGGAGAGSSNHGVSVSSGSITSTGQDVGGRTAADIMINGEGGEGTSDNDGVNIVGATAEVSSVDGDITITGTADGSTNDNTGVEISFEAQVSSTSGDIAITGTHGGTPTGNNNDGILIASDADISGTGGTVTLDGTGGGATTTSDNDGVQITGMGTTVMAGTGDFDGIGNGTTIDNDGVEISAGAIVTVASGIDIDGIGGSGTNDNNGILISGTGTRVTDNSPSPPTIDMDGTGMGTGSDNDGIEISGGAIVEGTDAAMVQLDGTGSADGTGTDNDGVEISGNDGMGVSSTVSSVNGNITITGTAGDGTNDNTGVEVSDTAQVTSTAANITITGTHGETPTGDNNDGIVIASDADISGTSGTVMLTGISAGTTAEFENDGVQITGTGTTVMAGTLDIDGTGNGSEDDNDGVEISAGAVVTVTDTADVRGTGGSAAAENDNHGVLITGTDGAGTDTSLSAGMLTIIGSGRGDESRNVGVEISAEADVTATGDGALTITGTGTGESTVDGVLITGADTTVTAGSAEIDGTGTLNGNSSNGDGVEISAGAVVTITGNALVDGTATGGEGGNNDGVFINGMNTEFNAGTATIQGTGFAGDTGASNDTGVEISGGAAVTIDNAAIINGTGGGDDSENLNDGVLITGDGTQLTTGNLTITGSGRGELGDNTGVEISDLANVMVTGTAMITGTGFSDRDDDNNDGVRIASDADVTITGTATIIGTGGGDDSDVNNNGVIITGAGTTLEADGLTITGTGDGNETGNDGVEISAGAMVTVASGIDIDGTGGANSTDDNRGVLITGTNTTVIHTGMTGAIDIDGTSMGGGRLNDGVEISSGALVNSTGTAPIQIDGTGSINSTDGINRGVEISSAEVRSIDGDVSIIGTGGTGTTVSGSSNQGVRISQSDIRIDGMANVIVNGTAGEGTDADGRTTNGVEIFGSTIGDDDTNFGAMDLTGDATGFIILDANADQLDIVQSTIRTNADGEGTIRRILLSGNQIDISNGESATFIQALSQNGGQGEIVAAPDSGDTVNVQLGVGAVDNIGATDVFGLTDVELNTMEARVVRIGSADILAPGEQPTITNQFTHNVNQDGTPMPPAPVDPMNPTIEERNMMLAQPFETGTSSTISVVGNFTADVEFATDLFQLRTNGDAGTQTVAINPGSSVMDLTVDLATNNPGRHFEAYAGLDITQEDADVLTATGDAPVMAGGGMMSSFSDGSLDPDFDGTDGPGDGLVVVEPTMNFDFDSLRARRILQQPDGNLLVVGDSFDSTFVVARLLEADGTYDPTFDGDGRLEISDGSDIISGATDAAFTVDMGGELRIVIVGYDNDGNIKIALLEPDGTPDTTFGTAGNGFVTTDPSVFDPAGNPGQFSDFEVTAVSVDGMGRIVVAGSVFNSDTSSRNFAVVRYNADGSIDTTFGDFDGMAIADFDAGAGSDDEISEIAIDAAGNIVAVGLAEVGGLEQFGIARFDSTGTLDTTFDTDGLQTTVVRAGVGSIAYDVVIQPDGNIVVAGSVFSTAMDGSDLAVVRYTTTGALDATFDGDGIVTVDVSGINDDDSGNGVDLQSDGRIVVAGSTSPRDFAVVRLTTTGSLDNTFGGDGIVVTSFSDDSFANDVVVQQDQQIVATGFNGLFGEGLTGDFALARYAGDDGNAVGNFTGDDDRDIVDFQPTSVDGDPIFRDGDVHFFAERMVSVTDTSTIRTEDGEITLRGNQQTSATSGTFDGVEIVDSRVTTGTDTNPMTAAPTLGGNILIEGRAGDSMAASDQDGVFISNSTVESLRMDDPTDADFNGILEAGSITILGTGGPGVDNNDGVEIVSTSTISSVDGDITIDGTGGSNGMAGSSDNLGVAIRSESTVESIGEDLSGRTAATITIDGIGGSGEDRNTGVVIEDMNTLVTSIDGNIEIDGTSNGTGAFNHGVQISNAAQVESTGTGTSAATITIDGTGGPGTRGNVGVFITLGEAAVTSIDGDIAISGTGGGDATNGESDNDGVIIFNTADVTATGTANITVTGTGNTGTTGVGRDSEGVTIFGDGTTVTTNSGMIDVDGTGANGGTFDNEGVNVAFGALVGSTTGNITLDGTGGAGDDDNDGVQIDGANTRVTNVLGNITITGTGGTNFITGGNDNHGVEIGSGAVVDTTGTGMDIGNITITGTGRGDSDNEGVRIHSTDTFVRTIDGDILVTGSSSGFGDENEGVNIDLGAVVRTTGTGDDAGNITLKGKGSGSNSGEGVLIEGMGTTVDVVDGDIMVVGRSEAFGDGNEGVEVQNQARVESTGMGMGAGTITLDGIGTGSNDSEGVLITGTDTLVTSIDGDITIMGDTIATNDNNEGVEISDGAEVSSTGMGDMAANITIHGFTGVCDEGEGGGVPVNDSEAVLITGAGSTVGAVDGDIEIIGINNSTGSDNAAVEVSDSGLVEATGDGTINIAGLDNNNNFGDRGVLIDGAASTVSSNTGIITITAAALNDNSEPEVAGNLQMNNAGRVLSNEADINLNSTNDVQLGIVNADFDNAGTAGTVFVIADAPATFNVPITGMMGGGEGGGEAWICMDPAMTTPVTIDPNGFGAIADNLMGTEDPNITAAATSLVAADGIGAGEHTVNLTTGLPDTTDDADIDTNVGTLAAFNGSNIDGSHDNDGNINVENHSGTLLTLNTVGTTMGVQNQGTGDNDDTTPGGDISILNNAALDIGPAGVINDSGGRIIITAASTGMLDGDLGIRGDVAVTNGIGTIMLNGGDNVGFGPGNTISTDTVGSAIDINAIQGDVTGDFVSAGSTTLIQTTDGTAVRGKPVIISSEVPQIDIFGNTTLTATFGTPGETNLLWTIDWGDGTVEQFVVDAGTHTRSHTYTENPSGNDADPIPINFNVEHDDSIAVDGFVGQPNPSASETIDYTINNELDFAETPGTGFGATVFQFANNSPALSFPETATATGLDNIVETSTLEQIDSGDRVVPGDSTAAEDEKLVLRLTLPSGDTKDFPLPNDILEGDNVKVLWKRLTDGRYQIVLIREDGTERVVLSVEVRGGRAIIRDNKPGTEQDSTNNNKEESNQENGEAEANQQNGEAAPDEMSRLQLRPTQPADPIVAPVPVETTATDTESVSDITNQAVSQADDQSAGDTTDVQERPTVSAAALFGSAIAYRSLRRGSSAHGEWDEQVETALAKSAERSLGRAARLRRQLLR